MTASALVLSSGSTSRSAHSVDDHTDDVDTQTLLQNFDALWNASRFTRQRGNRVCSGWLYREANKVLASIPDAELPNPIVRDPSGNIAATDIVVHVDALRAILATK